MIADYISFNFFSKSDYAEFINDIPKEVLLKPLRNIQKYKNHPRIKPFRDEYIDEKFVRSLYIKEFNEGKNQLQNHLLTFIDKIIIKKKLSNDDYLALKNKNCDDQKFEYIVLKLLKEANLKSKYLQKLLNLNDHIMYKYENEKKDRKNKKIINTFEENENKFQKRIADQERTIDELKQQNERLIKENLEIKSALEKIQNLNAKIEKSQKNEKKIVDISELMSSVEKDVKNKEYNFLIDIYKKYDLENKSLDDLFDNLFALHKQLFEQENYEDLKSIIFIEYIFLNLKEIMNNGR